MGQGAAYLLWWCGPVDRRARLPRMARLHAVRGGQQRGVEVPSARSDNLQYRRCVHRVLLLGCGEEEGQVFKTVGMGDGDPKQKPIADGNRHEHRQRDAQFLKASSSASNSAILEGAPPLLTRLQNPRKNRRAAACVP